MKSKKFCKYFNVNTNNCELDDCNNRCCAIEGKSCPDYEKYDYENELINRILDLEKRVHKLEEILAFKDFMVD